MSYKIFEISVHFHSLTDLSTMDIENTLYPLSRSWYSGDYRFYYAYGNTSPQDFLQNVNAEKEPSILVLGCGDIRSCFYSLWKNFDVKGPARFKGVHFLLNDISPAVLARDILFLYLCLKMPEEEVAMKKWLSGMWAIWYCHELHQEHYDMLNASLRELSHFSDTWSSNDNPLHSLVKFNSPATKNAVKLVWRMWLHQHINVSSVQEMLSSRASRYDWERSNEIFASEFVESCTKFPFKHDIKVDPIMVQARKSEVLSYRKSGSVYAEAVLGLEMPTSQTLVNLTFYEKKDGTYNLHFSLLPFSCFHQSIEFSSQYFDSSSCVHMLVEDKHFSSNPFLANSVQQFCLWLGSSYKILRSVSKLKFSVDASHALALCYDLGKGEKSGKFDLIYSSNLMDHLAPPNLMMSAVPLLKNNGLLFTSTFFKSPLSISFENYLALYFGFACKYFPVILGIRCINHEGEGYASPVMVKPCPPPKHSLVVIEEDLLICQKLPPDTIPLVFSDQPLTPTLAEALLRFMQMSVLPLFREVKLSKVIHLCVETAVKVILTFMSNTRADYSPDFWMPLCSLLQQHIKPYLSCLQTQLFLHGVHMHLTVSEQDCLMCLQKPVPNSIGLFSTTFSLKGSHMTQGTFIAFVHKKVVDDAEVLRKIANSNGDVHVFDCASSSSSDKQLYFYAPLSLVSEGYKVTVVAANVSSPSATDSRIVSLVKINLPTQPLSSLLIPFKSFIFSLSDASEFGKFELQQFGTIVSHVSDGDTSKLEISLSQHVVASSSKLQSTKVSSDTIRLAYGEYTCQLKFPYPIVYGRVCIKVKRSDGVMCLQCPRAVQQFVEEQPLFGINPDKELAMASVEYSESELEAHGIQQFTPSEHMEFEATGRDISKKPVLARVKELLFLLIDLQNATFVLLVHPEGRVAAQVLINRRLFDYENRVPVVDLAFCFRESVSAEELYKPRAPAKTFTIDVDEEECRLLKSTFEYFASRTYGTCETNSLLSEQRIQKYFTRAVVSLLLCDPYHYSSARVNTGSKMPTSDSDSVGTELVRCGSCNKSSEEHELKACARCKKVKYCGKDCQTKHWNTHKHSCKAAN